MRISGRRADGALYLSLGARVAVLLRGDRVTPTLDEAVIEAMGPWEPVDNSHGNRKVVQQLLDRARVCSVDYFALGGAGSGNFGHAGRPGQEGGSGPGGGGSNESKSKPFAGAHMVGGGQADPMIDFGGDVKRRSDWVEAIKNRGGTDDDVTRFDEGVKEKTQERLARGAGHPEIRDQMRKYVGERNVLDELDEAAAEEAGRYWASPEGQRIKAESATRKVHPGGKDKMSPARQKQHDNTVAYRKENRRAQDKPDPGVWVKDTPKSKGHAGRPGAPGGRAWSADERHNYERATGKKAKYSDDQVEAIINAAQEAAQWKLSVDSTVMQQNIHRNAVYRQTLPYLSAKLTGPVTDDDLFELAEDLTDDDLAIVATAFGMDLGDRGNYPDNKYPNEVGESTEGEKKPGLFGKIKQALGIAPKQEAPKPLKPWETPEGKAEIEKAHARTIEEGRRGDAERAAAEAAKTPEQKADDAARQKASEDEMAASDARRRERNKKSGSGTRIRRAGIFNNDPNALNLAKEKEESPFVTEDEPIEGEGENPLEVSEDEEGVALDQFHSLDDEPKDEKKPVSEVAQATQSGEAAAPPPAVEIMNLMPVDPDSPEGRKQRRGAMRDKIRAAAKSKGKTADTLDDAEITDEDLFAMAKELGVTLDEAPAAVVLIDNADRYAQLLSATTYAKHIHLAGGEHPFQYCLDTVVPSMADEGKAPDDPNAFCAWWKTEGPGAG